MVFAQVLLPVTLPRMDARPEAWEKTAQWYDRYSTLVYRRALQLLGSPAKAEDATQEVFMRAARSMKDYDDRAKPTTWLYRITTNLCLNRLRDARRRSELLDQRAEEVAPGSVGYDVEKMAALRELLSRADEREAAAAVAVFVDGMSHAEAAPVLGVSKRTVGNLCNRFVAWAKKELERPE